MINVRRGLNDLELLSQLENSFLLWLFCCLQITWSREQSHSSRWRDIISLHSTQPATKHNIVKSPLRLEDRKCLRRLFVYLTLLYSKKDLSWVKTNFAYFNQTLSKHKHKYLYSYSAPFICVFMCPAWPRYILQLWMYLNCLHCILSWLLSPFSCLLSSPCLLFLFYWRLLVPTSIK